MNKSDEELQKNDKELKEYKEAARKLRMRGRLGERPIENDSQIKRIIVDEHDVWFNAGRK